MPPNGHALPTASVSTGPALRPAPEHLNSTGCRIRHSEGKGRGVFASRDMDAHVVIEISPVLLFTSAEYEAHGKHTILDHYTFVWRDGRFALALGLGSLFNHSEAPNVSYSLDPTTESIRYMTTRRISEGEELCIFYGHTLWFQSADVPFPAVDLTVEEEDGWGGLLSLDGPSGLESQLRKYEDDRPDTIVPTEGLPFVRMKFTPDDAEEDFSVVRTEKAWVVDVPDPKQIPTMLKWLKQSGLETPSMAHLKRIRRSESSMTILLAFIRSSPSPPLLPDDIDLPRPYVLTVPRTAALTLTSLKLKSTFWPTIYTPRRKSEVEDWSRGKVLWALAAMKNVVHSAQRARAQGELPIAAYVPLPYDDETRATSQMLNPFTAHDTRTTTAHPLRHAILNVIRAVADYRSSTNTLNDPSQRTGQERSPDASSAPNSFPSTPTLVDPIVGSSADATPRNGAHYLLTSLTLFTTHEPCIMCSMALLHSRVKEIFYLVPMAGTGGCGSVTCIPKLNGVNHRFGINKWHVDPDWIEESGLVIDAETDA
ncbi:hypothetical protein B0H21DRAFT_72779 [Amylocystis lapponica]|nr:hypothetical protein B0H21DRAFT_72779 [Amylocystis lapponica]